MKKIPKENKVPANFIYLFDEGRYVVGFDGVKFHKSCKFQERYSRDGTGGDQISTLQSQVEEVKGVMTQNIEKVLERGERLEELMEKTTELESGVSKLWSYLQHYAIITVISMENKIMSDPLCDKDYRSENLVFVKGFIIIILLIFINVVVVVSYM